MRVPIQRLTDGKFIATIDFEETPAGFEDVFNGSVFYRRYQETRAHGEYGSPDLTALTGNPTAQLMRRRGIEENRTCLTLIQIGYFDNRFLQMEVKPFGPFGNMMRNVIDTNEPHYLTFRIEQAENEEGEMVVTQITGADFTTAS